MPFADGFDSGDAWTLPDAAGSSIIPRATSRGSWRVSHGKEGPLDADP
jgi:hypothetical protein